MKLQAPLDRCSCVFDVLCFVRPRSMKGLLGIGPSQVFVWFLLDN